MGMLVEHCLIVKLSCEIELSSKSSSTESSERDGSASFPCT